MARNVFGIVGTHTQAESIVASLKMLGIRPDDVSILYPDKSGQHDFGHEKHTKAPEGAASGAGIGGLLGGGLGWLIGAGLLAIPGFGPFIAAGPIMAMLGGAALGAAAGGVTGSLVGLGIPELEAKRYEGKLKDGNILIAAHALNHEQVKSAQEAFRSNGATDITESGDKSAPGESTAAPTATVAGRIEPYGTTPSPAVPSPARVM